MPNKLPIESTFAAVERLIERLPKGNEFRADRELAREFFSISEDPTLPSVLRDFCIDLSLRASATEAGPLGIVDVDVLLARLNKIKAAFAPKAAR